MFITYEGNGEVLVTTKKREKQALEDWFTNGNRSPEKYYRQEFHGASAICLNFELRVRS